MDKQYEPWYESQWQTLLKTNTFNSMQAYIYMNIAHLYFNA